MTIENPLEEHVDGGARPSNLGPVAVGYVVKTDG